MLPAFCDLEVWEQVALSAWVLLLGDAGRGSLKRSELPPARYARALGDLCVQVGIREPRFHNRQRDSMAIANKKRNAQVPWRVTT